jgi:hypothetical protein
MADNAADNAAYNVADYVAAGETREVCCAATCNMLGDLYQQLGDHDNALTYLNRDLAITEAVRVCVCCAHVCAYEACV